MLCKQCNQVIPDDGNYCPHCGAHYPSIEKDKPTFDVEFLKKAFKKNKQKIESESESKETEWKAIPQKKKGKWGWGWYILFGFVYMGITKTYPDNGDSQSILVVIGIPLSLIIYFYVRNKVLSEMSSLFQRSFISGFISLMFTAAIVAGIAGLLKPDAYGDLNDKVLGEAEKLKIQISEFQKKDELLWEFFTNEPTTDNELKNNIKIVEKAIPLYVSKDSIVIAMYERMHSYLEKAEKTYPDKFNFSPSMSEIILSLINNAKIYSYASENKFNSLKAYYIACLNDDDAQDEIYNVYADSENELAIAEQNFMKAVNNFQEQIQNLDNR